MIHSQSTNNTNSRLNCNCRSGTRGCRACRVLGDNHRVQAHLKRQLRDRRAVPGALKQVPLVERDKVPARNDRRIPAPIG